MEVTTALFSPRPPAEPPSSRARAAGGGFAMAHSQVSVLPPYDQRAGQRGQQRRRTRPPSEDRATGPGLPGTHPAPTGAALALPDSPAPCSWTRTSPLPGLCVLVCEVRPPRLPQAPSLRAPGPRSVTSALHSCRSLAVPPARGRHLHSRPTPTARPGVRQSPTLVLCHSRVQHGHFRVRAVTRA